MPTVRPGVIARLTPHSGILGCINDHDGSGFIHALLEAYHPAYAREQSDHYRTHLAKSVRIGALPAILQARYGSKPLCAKGCTESRSLFNQAVAYGSPLPGTLLRDYAEYLGVAYRLHDADLQLIEEYSPEGRQRITPCHIVMAAEDEYHLIVRLFPSKRGDKQGTVRFRVLDDTLSAD